MKLLFFFIIFFVSQNLICQSFYGVTGIIKTPSADVQEFKSISVGMGYTKDTYYASPEKNYHISYFLILGILPNLEFSARLGGDPSLNIPDPEPYLDRMVSMKYNLFKEGKYYPAFTIGIQDFIGKAFMKHFNCFYFIAMKTYQIPLLMKTKFNIGFGSKLWDNIVIKSENYRFIGLFGSIENIINKYTSIIGEYDSKNFNAGIKFNYKNLISLKIYLTEGKYIGSIANISVLLL